MVMQSTDIRGFNQSLTVPLKGSSTPNIGIIDFEIFQGSGADASSIAIICGTFVI